MVRPSGVPRRRLPAWLAAVVAGVLGASVPLQSRLNGELGTSLGDPFMAAVVSFGGGLVVMALIGLSVPVVRRGLLSLPGAVTAGTLPWYYLAAGSVGGFLVLTQATAVAIVGVAVFTVAVVAGQVISGIVIDTVGFAASERRPPGPARLVGAALVLLAVTLSAFSGAGVDTSLGTLAGPALLAFVAGSLTGFQFAMNGHTGSVGGSALVATVLNFLTGMLLLLVLLGVRALVGAAGPWTWPSQWWLYVGGLFGIVYIGGLAALTPRTGVLLVGLGSVAGQLLASLLLDVVAPVGAGGVSVTTVLATTLALVAIVVATVLPARR